MRSKGIHKKLKTALILSSIAAVLLIGTFLLFCACWSGAFHFLHPKEIATYNSPDGTYTLVFEQMGDPQWPFGATDVRLTLKNRDEKVLERVSAQLNDDGANAGTHNITAVFWNDDAVTVVLSASEMDDKEVSIPYKNS